MSAAPFVRKVTLALLIPAGFLGMRAGGSWSPAAQLNIARVNPAVALLGDGRVLATAGRGGSALLTAELYDPDAATWTLTGPLNTGHDKATATLLNGGQLLLAGGGTPESELYDPVSNSWSLTSPMRIDRLDHAATLLPDGRVLVSGGATFEYAVGNTLSAELYDPSTGKWTLAAPMNVWRTGHQATLLKNGMVLVTGGDRRYGPGNITPTAELYDPATNSWTLTGDMANVRTRHTATLMDDGRVLVAGGYNFPGAPGFAYVRDAEIYDASTGAFTSAGAMNDARSYHTATLLNDGSVLVTGGFNNQDDPRGVTLRSAEIFDPATGAWTPTDSMRLTRWLHSAARLFNGTVLVVGGNEDPGKEIFVPVP